jgi:esterase/lipase superfamily enzyme
MNVLGDRVVEKMKRLLNYREMLDANPGANPDALVACNKLLEQVAELIARLLKDPSSTARRLADMDFLLNETFDDNFDARVGSAEHQERSARRPGDEQARSSDDPIKEIIRILVDTGYLPGNIAQENQETSIDAEGRRTFSPDMSAEHTAAEELARDSVDHSSTDAEYLVWFGTNRRPNDPLDAGKGYSSERSATTHYGTCRVFVPESHKIGSVGSSWWRRVLTSTDDRLHLLEVTDMVAEDYWRAVSDALDKSSIDDRDAVVFVHGYNVSFREAALRAAQIGFDLSIKRAMAFFSWPSRGTLEGYATDEASIEASEKAITQFMIDFVERSGAETVHVIAHSMGNRAVLRAVNRIAAKAKRQTGKHFGQLILAAADVDTDLFRDLCRAYEQVAQRTTLYISRRDLAVEASKWLHTYPRVGLTPPIVVAPGIDTVNVANIDMTVLGHGYVAGARDVLRDIHCLITQNLSPKSRFGLRSALNEEGERYWLIGA